MAIQNYSPKYQVAWNGTAVETYCFHLFVLYFLWTPLPTLWPASCLAWGAQPDFRLPPETRESSLAKLILQGETQSDPLDPQEESLWYF